MTDAVPIGSVGGAVIAVPALETGAASADRALRKQVVRGSAWTIIGFVGTQAIRLAGNLILARLVPLSAFGMMGLVSAFLAGLELLSDLGGGGSIVQHPRGETREFLRTAWTIAALRGVALWLIACFAALPFAWAYGQPLLAWIMPISGLSALAAGLLSARVHVLNRRMKLGPIVAIEVGSMLFGQVVMIAWAWMSPSVWALVTGGLSATILKIVLTHTVLPGPRDGFGWDRAAVSAVVTFGSWIFVSSILTFVVGQSDRLIFGQLIPLDLLGAYNAAVMLATMPSFAVGALGIRILFPVFSRMHHDAGGLERHFTRARRPLLIGSGWVISGMIAGGPTIIALLYPPTFAPAGWMLSVLSAGAWLTVLEAGNGSAFFAQGKGKFAAAANAGKLMAMIVLIPAGYWFWGFPGAVGAFAGAEGARYAVSSMLARRLGLRSWRQDLAYTLVVIAAAGAGYLAARFASSRGASIVFEAAAVFVVVTLIWLPFAAPQVLRRRAAAGLEQGSVTPPPR